jgi:hypothetical protein
MNGIGTGRRLVLAGTLTAAVAVGLLLALGGSGPQPHPRFHPSAGVTVLEGARAFHFDTLPEMVATSTTVVRGTVVAASRGMVIDEGDVTYTRRLLTIQVHKRLAGRPVGSRVAVETAGWQQVDGEAETKLRVVDDVPVVTGASGVFFLYDFEHNGRYGFVDDQGVLLADGAEVSDSTRTDPLVRGLERRTMADLEAGIASAEKAVRQGRVAPRPYPGRSG